MSATETAVSYKPVGVRLSDLTETLTTVDPEFKESPWAQDLKVGTPEWPGSTPEERLFNRMKSGQDDLKIQMGRWTGNVPVWEKGSAIKPRHDMEFNPPLSFQDICRIRESSVVETCWSNLFGYDFDHQLSLRWEREEFVPNMNCRVFGKITNSLWRWGYKSDYNTAALAFNQIRDFEIDGFEVRLDYASHFNPHGYATYHRIPYHGYPSNGITKDLYLDGPLAYCLYYRGKHVLTLSFAVMIGCIGITQIQLRNDRGNRWLYKVGGIEQFSKLLIERMRSTFSSLRLLIVDSESLVDSLTRQIDGIVARNGTTPESEQYRQKFEQSVPRIRKIFPRKGKSVISYNGFNFVEA